MSFNDFPKIDKSSQFNELSERKLEAELNQQSGFICRRDVPDKGCDYDVELIIDKSNVSNWRFAVQLKSIENPTFVIDNQYLSYSFETSRLGYLMNRLPAMGIIVIYSVSQDLLYFDFVDKIYERLITERESDDWKHNDKVNILIPITNIVNSTSIIYIHSIFENRFRSALMMQSSHGKKYNLPSVTSIDEFQYDFNNIDHIKQFLTDCGMYLLSEQDLKIIFDLVSKIPAIEIYGNKNLMIVAAVTYCEVSLHADSAAYVSKLLKRTDLSQEELATIAFTRLKNQRALGEINNDHFSTEIRKMKTVDISKENEICLSINIDFFDLLSLKPLASIPATLINSIEDTFTKIEMLDSGKQRKWLLEAWNADNYAFLVSTFRQRLYTELRLRESFGREFTQNEKKERLLFIISIQDKFYRIVEKLDQKAKELNNDQLQAHTINLYNRFILTLEIDYIAYQLDPKEIKPNHEFFIKHTRLAHAAFSIFLNQNHYKEAYQSLCHALELIEISRNKYLFNDEFDAERLLSIKQQIEQQFDITPCKLIMSDLINQVKENHPTESENGFPLVKNMDDNEIENLSRIFLTSKQLPEDQLGNIIDEMKAYRIFHNRCIDSNLEIFEEYEIGVPEIEHFKKPVKFIIVHKKTGIQSAPSSNIEDLLTAWGY